MQHEVCYDLRIRIFMETNHLLKRYQSCDTIWFKLVDSLPYHLSYMDSLWHFGSSFSLLLQSIVLTLQLISMAAVFYKDVLAMQVENIGKTWLQKFLQMAFCLRKMHLGN